MNELWDMIIVGGGPAGIAAAIYAGRSRLKTVILEKGLMGGNINNTERIENYPGFPGGIDAFELTEKFKSHAEEVGVEVQTAEAKALRLEGKTKIIISDEGEYRGKTVIIATGCSPVKLNCEGEKDFWGRGVSACATCDGPFYKDLRVAVVGGGNAAVEESLYLTKFAKEVFIIHRRDQLRAVKVLQERAMNEPKIKFEWNSVVERIIGKEGVEGVELKNLKSGEKKILPVDGVFVFIGLKPHSDWLADVIERDRDGYIIVDRDMKTNVPGVYAAGDVTNRHYRQIIISAGEGARAALVAEKYLSEEW